MTTAQDQQSREAYEDGKWYWVEHEGWHSEPPTIAPACYKAECDAWYSYIFSGISTPYLKVLGPCELQAARALPAPVICYVRPRSTLPRRMGWETCAATDAGALAVHADGRAVPTGVEPVAWTVAGDVTNWARDFSKYKTQHYVQPVFTAAQVLAMGRVPPGWQAVPADRTEEMKRAAMELLLDGLDIYVNAQDQIVIETDAPRRLWKAFLAAAPPPPAVQEPSSVSNADGGRESIRRALHWIDADLREAMRDYLRRMASDDEFHKSVDRLEHILRQGLEKAEPAP